MSGERIEVEVVCQPCGGTGLDGEGVRKCGWCKGDGWDCGFLASGSLSEAKMRLAEAAYDVGPFFRNVNGVRLEFNTALAAVQELQEDAAFRALTKGETE